MYYQLSEMMTDKRHMSAPPHHSYRRGYSRKKENRMRQSGSLFEFTLLSVKGKRLCKCIDRRSI